MNELWISLFTYLFSYERWKFWRVILTKDYPVYFIIPTFVGSTLVSIIPFEIFILNDTFWNFWLFTFYSDDLFRTLRNLFILKKFLTTYLGAILINYTFFVQVGCFRSQQCNSVILYKSVGDLCYRSFFSKTLVYKRNEWWNIIVDTPDTPLTVLRDSELMFNWNHNILLQNERISTTTFWKRSLRFHNV